MKKITIIILILLVCISCQNSNVELQEYPLQKALEKNNLFSIDSILPNNTYLSTELFFYNDSVYRTKFSFWVNENKFYAKLRKPEVPEFVLFDFDSKLNQVKKIKIEKLKSFDCVLEKKFITKEKIEVHVFRIKKWRKLDDFFGGEEIDMVFFTTKENGVIGSYSTDKDNLGNQVIFGSSGEIFKDYIDYSNIRDVVLE